MSIKKIAKAAGVSISTVSRVLNNPNYKCSSEEIRDRILKVAREMNYVPNESARNLKKGMAGKEKLRYIGILLTRAEESAIDPFFTELMRMVESEIHRNMCILTSVWYQPLFSVGAKDEDIQAAVAAMFAEQEKKIDGMVIIGRCDREVIRQLGRHCKNIVSVNRNSTNYEIDEVLCDGRKIATLAVEHLIHLGHREIGYVGDCHNESRFLGYRQTLEKYNINCDPFYIFEAQAREEQGYQIMERILQQSHAPTGIYCANDILAVGMLKCLNNHKNRYYTPSIISSDDISEAQYTTPMLTTVHLPTDEMAKYVLFLLLDRIDGGHKSVIRMELECTLVIRGSCTGVENSMGCEYYI
ncbi:MAG: LacI family transcriptional regulator [Clostridia bacterium]|nr:LacI family transcriptional regulator [Clostridia bacterium]